MANVIKIKRSTSTNTPTSLAEGELAYSEASNTLFIGTSGSNIDNIAGIGNTALITGQTAETSIDGDNDYLLVYDGSATGFKKVLTKYVGSLAALGITASAAELNILDGATLDVNELNTLDGITASTAELNLLDGVTATTSELNILDGATLDVNELNTLDGITASTAELNIVDGGTSATSTTVASGDRVVYNDNGTMVQVDVDDIDTYFSATTKTLTNKTISGSSNTLSNIGNSSLTNSSVTIGSTALALGGTATTLAGLTSVTSTGFTGDLTGDVTGDVTGNLTGSVLTASQTNITAVGTLNGLTIAGSQSIDMGGNRVTNLDEPTQASDAATKNYVDAVKTGLDIKDSVRAATTGNITISTALNNGDTLDGVTLVDGDRVLVKDQTDASQNGIYVVGSTPARATDFDSSAEVTGGAFTFVEEGTANADNGYVVTTNGTITVDSSDIEFAQFSGAGQITAGNALTKTGNTLDVAVDDSSIEVSGDALQVKALGITNAMLAGSIDLTAKVTGTLPVANGGTGLASFTSGDLTYASGSTTLSKLGIGTAGQFLTVSSGAPAWTDTIDGGTF